jgi:hypothetical protein
VSTTRRGTKPEPARPWWADVQHLRDAPVAIVDKDAHPPSLVGGDADPGLLVHRDADPGLLLDKDAEVASLVDKDADLPSSVDVRRTVTRPLGRSAPRPAPPIWLAEDPKPDAPAGRRTIEIRGRTVGAPPVPRLVDASEPTPARRPHSRSGRRAGLADRMSARPDRIALWAFLMGLFLIVVAAMSAHGG